MSYQNDALLRFLRGETGGVECTGESSNEDTAENGGVMAGRSLAMVYSPEQHFRDLYEPEEALCRGTLFHELEKPFHGAGREK